VPKPGQKRYCLTGYVGGSFVKIYTWSYSETQAARFLRIQLNEDFENDLTWARLEDKMIVEDPPKTKDPA